MSDSIKPNDGGPAFPFPSGPEPRVNEFHDRSEGMSLRAYFAGQVLAEVDSRSLGSPADIAAECCQLADAIIAELNKHEH